MSEETRKRINTYILCIKYDKEEDKLRHCAALIRIEERVYIDVVDADGERAEQSKQKPGVIRS